MPNASPHPAARAVAAHAAVACALLGACASAQTLRVPDPPAPPGYAYSAAESPHVSAGRNDDAWDSDTTPDERREWERERERERQRARRDAERDLARARREAAADRRGDSLHIRVDLGGLAEIGRAVGESVSEGMRGAAEGIRAAALVLRDVDWGSDYDVDRRDGQEPTRLDTTVAVSPGVAVDLSLVSGPVTVTAWNRSEVRVSGRSDRLPLRFERTDGPSGGSVRVYTVRTRGRSSSSGEQRLDVVVPLGTRVTANSVSGDVRVTGVRGELDAETVSGDVDVQGATRRVSLTSVSGNVRGQACDGAVRARSVSGDVRLDSTTGEADVGTVSGGVELRVGRLSRLRAQTVSGDLSYDGTLARDGRYDLSTQSGEVRLVMPGDAGAALSLQTFSGSIDTSIPLTLQPTGGEANSWRRAKRMEFTVGGGGARVTAQSFSGSIVIARSPNTPRQ